MTGPVVDAIVVGAEACAAQLRDQVELEAVGRGLVAIRGQAVQPASASVWVRGGSSR